MIVQRFNPRRVWGGLKQPSVYQRLKFLSQGHLTLPVGFESETTIKGLQFPIDLEFAAIKFGSLASIVRTPPADKGADGKMSSLSA